MHRAYTSARIHTQGRVAWRRGRIEVRARLPRGQGLWPAIWMLPQAHVVGESPLLGEIDIAEAVNLGTPCGGCRSGVERRVWGVLHEPPPGKTSRIPGGRGAGRSHRLPHLRPGVVGQGHDLVARRAPYHRVAARNWLKADDGPFDQPYYLVINLAVGGGWPERSNQRGVDAGALPAALVVDWVRVFGAR